VYRGFHTTTVPAGERFASLEPTKHLSGGGYSPIHHLITFNLTELPTTEQFFKFINCKLPEDERE
jgi:hypothetical protein